MIFMEAFFFIGLMGGSLLSSFVYIATGATTTFIISGLLMCGATVFIVVCVPESLHYSPNQEIGETIKCTTTNLNGCCDQVIKEKQIENTNIDSLDMSKNMKGNQISELTINAEGKVVEVPADEKQKDNNKIEMEAKRDLSSCQKACTDTNMKNLALKNPNAEQKSTEEKPKKAGLFSYVHIKDMLVTCFKTRPFYDRGIIWLVTGTMFLSIFVIGELLCKNKIV